MYIMPCWWGAAGKEGGEVTCGMCLRNTEILRGIACSVGMMAEV